MSSILIAEPNPDVRALLARQLHALGHEVVDVGSGAVALDLIESGGVDLLLASVILEGMDGIELVHRAEKLGWLGPVLFLTGFAAVPVRRGVGDPKARVLAKPIHLRELPDAVDRMLRKRMLFEG